MRLPRRVLAQLLAHLVAADARHHHVEQDEIGTEFADGLQRVVAGVHDTNVVALLPHQELEGYDDVGLIIGDEDLLRHAVPPAVALYRSRARYATGTGRVSSKARATGSSKPNIAPPPGVLSHPELSAEMLDDLPTDRQPEPGPLRLLRHRVPRLAELLEDDLAVVALMPGPLSITCTCTISPSDASSTSTRPCAAGTNLAAFESRLMSTCTRRSRSARTMGTASGSRESTRDVLRSEQVGRGGERVFDHCLEVDLGHVPLRTTGFELGEVEHLIDESRETLAFLGDDGQELVPLRRVEIGIVVQDLGERADRGQRRAELVRHGRHEVVLRVDRAPSGARWQRGAPPSRRRARRTCAAARGCRRSPATPRPACRGHPRR